MSKFIRLKGVDGSDLNVNTAHIIAFSSTEGGTAIATSNNGSALVVESTRVIRGLIEPKIAE